MATFDDVMVDRIKAFQQSKGLAVTGVVSKETWEILLQQTSQEAQAPDPGKAAGEVMLDPKEFPLTYEIATLTTEDAVKAFLKGRGIDLDAIVAYGEAIESKLSDIS